MMIGVWMECYCGTKIRLAPAGIDWVGEDGSFECYEPATDTVYHEAMQTWKEET